MSLRFGFGREPLAQHHFFHRPIRVMTLIDDAKMIALLPNEDMQRFHQCGDLFSESAPGGDLPSITRSELSSGGTAQDGKIACPPPCA